MSRLRCEFNSAWTICGSEKLLFFFFFLPFATLTTHLSFYRDAFSHVQERRFCINPNVGFVHQLQASSRQLNQRVNVQNSKNGISSSTYWARISRDVFETCRIGSEWSCSRLRFCFLFFSRCDSSFLIYFLYLRLSVPVVFLFSES